MYEKEYFAILFVVDQWRSYIQHDEFIIKTDQKSLIRLDDQRLSTPWQKKAVTKLMGLHFKVLHKRVENKTTDSLSRRPNFQGGQAPLEVLAVSFAQPVWLEQVVNSYVEDENTKKIMI